MKKQKSSIFLEPYNLVKLVIEAVRLLTSLIKAGFNTYHNEQKAELTHTKQKEAFAMLSKELETDEFKQNWKRFIYGGLLMQGFLFIMLVFNMVYLNVWGSIQLLGALVCALIFFAYKPWILKNSRVAPFMVFLKELPRDLSVLWLWNAKKWMS